MCGHPWPVRVPSCPECPPHLRAVGYLSGYGHTARAVVSAVKDRGRYAVLSDIAEMLVHALPAPPADAPLVPVPLTRDRERGRGFNQSDVLARELGRRWERPVVCGLRRTGEGPPQRGASRTIRLRQIRGAFRVVGDRMTDVRAAVIVDDVLTTGATLGACARALHGVGVTAVGAVVIARVERSVGPSVAVVEVEG